jgi:hypothetical protein
MTKRSTRYGDEEVSTQSVPIVVDAPYIQQEGSTVTCTMGNWDEAATPDSFSYAWTLDGVATGVDLPTLELTPSAVGATVMCTLTATNAEGSASADSNQIVVEEADFAAPTVNMDEPKTYRALEETSIDDPENPGEKIVKAKDEEFQMSMNQARRAIDSGARIIGID